MLDASQIFDGTFNPVSGVLIAATQPSTNVIDWMASRDMGVTDNLGIIVQVMQAFSNLTSLQIDYETAAAPGGPYNPLVYSPVIPLADLTTTGRIFAYAVPINQALNMSGGFLNPPGEYCRLNYTCVGAAETTGKLFSYIVPHLDRPVFYPYPSNYTLMIPPSEVLLLSTEENPLVATDGTPLTQGQREALHRNEPPHRDVTAAEGRTPAQPRERK